MHHPTDMITHTTAFVTPVVEHWLEHLHELWLNVPEFSKKGETNTTSTISPHNGNDV